MMDGPFRVTTLEQAIEITAANLGLTPEVIERMGDDELGEVAVPYLQQWFPDLMEREGPRLAREGLELVCAEFLRVEEMKEQVKKLQQEIEEAEERLDRKYGGSSD